MGYLDKTTITVDAILTKKGRVWRKVELKGVTEMKRPFSQGGLWYLAEWLRVVGPYIDLIV